MTHYSYPFDFSEDDSHQIRGHLELDEPLSFRLKSGESGFYRPGRMALEKGISLDLVLYQSAATRSFIYLRHGQVDPNLLELSGLSAEEIAGIEQLPLPGQLCMGTDRSNLIAQAIKDVFGAPPLHDLTTGYRQQNLAVFPIAREGLKYQIAEAIFDNYGYYCDEVVLDAHHVFDSSVPVYSRKVEFTIFKDADLDRQQHEEINVAFIGDSIASGLVMREVIAKVKERFDNIKHVEVIAPLATIRGLSRIAQWDHAEDVSVRVHIFETPLNALPPDYYYSAHYDIPEFHIRPELETEYRRWWGKDGEGKHIADTACAGFGWSEVFFSPRKQIEMINEQLSSRHDLALTDIIRRNISSK